jgi:preprotein translocase subunit YajC
MEIVILAIAYPVTIILLFYFAFLRPVQRQQRQRRREMANLRVGDEVLTQAGFIAVIKDIEVPAEGPTEIVLDLGDGVRVRAVATAVVQRLRPAQVDQEVSQAGAGRTKG